MNRRYRLTRTSDLQRVRRSGKGIRHPLVVMIYLKTGLPICRVGVIAGRSIGNAVQRNRAKRLIRNAVQPYLPGIGEGWDILLIARAHLAGSNFRQVFEAIGSLLTRSGILGDDDVQDR